jgi:hypothetical protein
LVSAPLSPAGVSQPAAGTRLSSQRDQAALDDRSPDRQYLRAVLVTVTETLRPAGAECYHGPRLVKARTPKRWRRRGRRSFGFRPVGEATAVEPLVIALAASSPRWPARPRDTSRQLQRTLIQLSIRLTTPWRAVPPSGGGRTWAGGRRRDHPNRPAAGPVLHSILSQMTNGRISTYSSAWQNPLTGRGLPPFVRGPRCRPNAHDVARLSRPGLASGPRRSA